MAVSIRCGWKTPRITSFKGELNALRFSRLRHPFAPAIAPLPTLAPRATKPDVWCWRIYLPNSIQSLRLLILWSISSSPIPWAIAFWPYPLGDRILVAATPRAAQAQGVLEQKLYRVATGIQVESPPAQLDAQVDGKPITAFPIAAAGTTELVLDSTAYQNLKFDLSADGKVIVVQRVSRTDPADFGPWILWTLDFAR